MKPIPSPQDQGWENEILKILKRLGSLKAEYPPELFAARRAAFLLQVEYRVKSQTEAELLVHEPFLQHLQNLKSINREYPLALRAARRAAFIEQIERYQKAKNAEELLPEDQEILQLFRSLKSIEAEYPPGLMSARRAAFRRRLASGEGVNVLDALRNSIRSLVSSRIKRLPLPTMSMMRTSLVVTVLMLATFVGSLLRDPGQSLPGGGISQIALTFSTPHTDTTKVFCKPGYLPPLCLVKPFDGSQDLTLQGNGSARPAVAKDTLPGYNGVHKAAYVNDGLYGPGTSWVSKSAYSWIKIDLGKATTINAVAFGKDRLGNSSGGDPGQFVIAVALNDNIYADGNSSNDYVEYAQVYDSKQAGFNGIIPGTETVQAQFAPVTARYIKITFANPRTTIDEVEAFMVKPPTLALTHPTRKPRENPAGIPPTSISSPASALVPNVTVASIPTNTPIPADTATLVPTDTPVPAPTDTPLPVPTDTSVPAPTDTPVPAPSDTPVPPNTPIPASTDTPAPPADTPVPAPTDTSAPPPANPVQAQPTDTSAPPAAAPLIIPTDTPIPAQP